MILVPWKQTVKTDNNNKHSQGFVISKKNIKTRYLNM